MHTPLCHCSLVVLWPPGAGRGSGCPPQQHSPPALSCELFYVGSQHQQVGREVAGRGHSASSPLGSGCASAPGSSGFPYGRHSPLCNYCLVVREKIMMNEMAKDEDKKPSSNKLSMCFKVDQRKTYIPFRPHNTVVTFILTVCFCKELDYHYICTRCMDFSFVFFFVWFKSMWKER